ncbi:MAG: CoA ester lyase [Alphaproteobacteria bacterium]|nr:CoA ester lyase [Alphaproteobacteria bacterium]
MTQDPVTKTKIARSSSFLFVPANRSDRIDKAVAVGPDYVIADLEDAVAPAEKNAARQSLRLWLNAKPAREILVRPNGVATPWHGDDLTLCRHPGVAGVVLPKADSVRSIEETHFFTEKPVLPIIETARAVVDVTSLAKAAGVCRLLFGKLDLAVEFSLPPDESDAEELVFLPYRAAMVLASALGGLPAPVDGVFTAIHDEDGLSRYASRARKHGFGAMLLIHPVQVAVVRRVFAPSSEELEWARKILDAVKLSGYGAIRVDGRMVDAPVIARARRILESTHPDRQPDP